MNKENQLSRYGAISKVVEGNPQAKVFFVANSASDFTGELLNTFPVDGDGVSRVFTSITSALVQCVAGRGDVIYVLPGYTENITGAAGIAIAKAGVRLVGLGQGRSRPTLTWTTAITAQITVTASNVSIENFVFNLTGFGAVTAGFSVTGADVSFLNNEFIISTGTNAPVRAILTAATADRLRVIGNRFIGPATSTQTCTAAISHEVGIDYVIENNEFKGKFTQAILNAATVLGGLIRNNTFVIGTGTAAITMAAASTPFITNNRMNVASGTAPIVAAAGFVAGNVYSAAAGVNAGTAATI